MVISSRQLDETFAAIADPTRRRILERLARGELTVGEIAAGFTISQPAISRHVKILERSGLIERSIDGRVHRCRLAPARMRLAASWLEEQQRFWNASLDRLDAYLNHTSPAPKGKRR